LSPVHVRGISAWWIDPKRALHFGFWYSIQVNRAWHWWSRAMQISSAAIRCRTYPATCWGDFSPAITWENLTGSFAVLDCRAGLA